MSDGPPNARKHPLRPRAPPQELKSFVHGKKLKHLRYIFQFVCIFFRFECDFLFFLASEILFRLSEQKTEVWDYIRILEKRVAADGTTIEVFIKWANGSNPTWVPITFLLSDNTDVTAASILQNFEEQQEALKRWNGVHPRFDGPFVGEAFLFL